MQENNMSVFGTVIRNEEIADFMRLLNLAREIFKQELTVVEIMPAAPGSTPLPSPGWSATWTRWPPSWPATVSASMQTGTCWSPATIIFPPSP